MNLIELPSIDDLNSDADDYVQQLDDRMRNILGMSEILDTKLRARAMLVNH